MIAELFVNSAWTDITSHVRISKGVTITRGRANETSEVAPSTCQFTLDNRTGNYLPRNPLGPYYGSLHRNTPFRLSVRSINDTMTRTVSNGWGSTPTGQAWTTSGGAAGDYAVASGKATHTLSAANSQRFTYLASTSYRDVEVQATWSLPFTNVTGAPVSAGLALRGQSTSSFYMVLVSVQTNESVTVDFCTFDGLSFTDGPVTISGLTHSSAQPLKIKAQTVGQTLRVKVWQGNNEPYGWHKTWVDEDPFGDTTALIRGRGWVGALTKVATGNTNVPVVSSFDDFQVRHVRFFGEISTWPAHRDVSGNDRYIEVEAAGITRRLGQGSNPLESAPRRFYTKTPQTLTSGTRALIGYWPLEEGPRAVQGVPVVGPSDGPFVITYSPQSTAKHFGQGQLAPWLPDAFSLYSTTITGVNVDMSTFTPGAGWMVGFIRRGRDNFLDAASFRSPGIEQEFRIEFHADLEELWVFLPGGSVQTVSAPFLFDDAVHHIQFSAVQSGADISWLVQVDGESLIGFLLVSTTLERIETIAFYGNAVDDGSVAIGSLAVHNLAFSTSAFEGHDAAFGFRGETAGLRFYRLAGEEGIGFDWIGLLISGTDTPAMGSQGLSTLLELLRECELADGGTIYDPRWVLGLTMRTHRSLYGQAATATVDYGKLKHPLDPVDDDQLTRNQVSARRDGGGEATAELTTGRLSTQDPVSGGVGRYSTSVTVNVADDVQLPGMAEWLVHLGTVDEERFPIIGVNLVAPGVTSDAALWSALLDLDLEDRLVVTNASSGGFYDGIDQLVRGYTETMGQSEWKLEFNCSPASPYRVVTLDSATLGRLDSDASTLTSGITSSATSFQVSISDGTLWTTAGAQFPMEIKVGGERIRLSGISGASSPQTFTVDTGGRAVNGVTKAHSAGAQAHIADPVYLGL